MNELIKRIDEIFSDQDYVKSYITPRVEKALRDCRAEIERLEARIAELEKPYVPMTDDETSQTMQDWYNDVSDETHLSRFIEAAVVKRYNEQRVLNERPTQSRASGA